jgi:hypothetical protein
VSASGLKSTRAQPAATLCAPISPDEQLSLPLLGKQFGAGPWASSVRVSSSPFAVAIIPSSKSGSTAYGVILGVNGEPRKPRCSLVATAHGCCTCARRT